MPSHYFNNRYLYYLYRYNRYLYYIYYLYLYINMKKQKKRLQKIHQIHHHYEFYIAQVYQGNESRQLRVVYRGSQTPLLYANGRPHVMQVVKAALKELEWEIHQRFTDILHIPNFVYSKTFGGNLKEVVERYIFLSKRTLYQTTTTSSIQNQNQF